MTLSYLNYHILLFVYMYYLYNKFTKFSGSDTRLIKGGGKLIRYSKKRENIKFKKILGEFSIIL